MVAKVVPLWVVFVAFNGTTLANAMAARTKIAQFKPVGQPSQPNGFSFEARFLFGV